MTPSFDIVIAAEAESDARRIKSLIDRILIADTDWLTEQPEHARPQLLNGLRAWRGQNSSATFLDIHKIHDLADALGLPAPRGHFDGRPAAQDYHSAVRALWLLLAGGLPRGLIWVRDTDGQISRVDGWKDACTEAGAEFSILIGGFPHECMEAWVLAAFTTVDRQTSTFRALREQLGFDPIAQSERLSHKQGVPRSAKKVCEALGIEDATWSDTAIDELAQQGHGCGLAAFIAEIRDKLVSAVQRGSNR